MVKRRGRGFVDYTYAQAQRISIGNGLVWLSSRGTQLCGYVVVWLRGFVVLWFRGFMVLWLWLRGCVISSGVEDADEVETKYFLSTNERR